MKSRARLLGHPVHQMLIVFPPGLLASAAIVASGWLHSPGEMADAPALACSFGGEAVALVAAWLGGELVARLGIGAGVDAPNSLKAP